MKYGSTYKNVAKNLSFNYWNVFFQSHPDVIEAGIRALKTHGAGLSSVRFICGTQDIHKVQIFAYQISFNLTKPVDMI